MAALQFVTGREPTIIGKPNRYILDAIWADFPHLDRGRALMIGDRLDTDIAFGLAGGLRTMLVLSGCSTRADAAGAAVSCAPHFVAPSVALLADAC